ncbi:MmgE/PrpD family protein [Lonepinella sp. BR2357]|uniref:MmgE/PrpD family protein n=1 Tax=Lonepinella sp. BR2357 TaxID=3434549 RepID=UPI003F6DC68A
MQGKQWAEKILATPIITDQTVINVALQGITDYFASLLSARQEKDVVQLKQMLLQEGGNPTSWFIGHSQSGTARQAALLNGFQAHYLDYDDVHEQVRGHPSAVILSALLASIKPTTPPLNSQRFLTAYIIGVEVMARLGEVMNPQHYNQGWHATGTLGGIAAVAAVTYLHQLDFLDQALSLAATQAAGLRLMFGSSVKPLHAGLAAQTAIQTVELLQAGLAAPTDFLDKEQGFIRVYAGSRGELDFSDWGISWRIKTPGLWFKTYAFCSAAATVADAAKLLKKTPQFCLENIEEIELIFNPKGDAALIYQQIQELAQGRFCAEYIVAKILLGEEIEQSAFVSIPVGENVQKMMAKMHRRYQTNATNTRFGEVKLRLKKGEFLSQRIVHPKGSPQNPYASSELLKKLEYALGNQQISDDLYRNIQALARGQSMQDFIEKYREI